MRKIYSILLTGVAVAFLASCGNNSSKTSGQAAEGNATQTTENTAEAAIEAESPAIKMYSNSFEGFTNIYKEAADNAEVIGKLRNGNEHVELVSATEEWVEVKFQEQTGFVQTGFLSEAPSKPVTIDVDGKWLEGVWSDSGFQYILLFADGKLCIEHQYSTLNYGKWHLEGNEIVLTMLADVDTGLDLSYPIGTVLRYAINKEEETLGNNSGYEIYKWDFEEDGEDEEEGISKSEFETLQKRTEKVVK